MTKRAESTANVVRKKRIVLVAVLVAVAVAAPITADRAVAAMAERRIAARLGCLAGITGDVDVTLAGFPFLTQLASGTFADLRVRARAVTFRDLTLNSIAVAAQGVRLPEGGEASVESFSADAVIAYGGLGSRFDLGAARFGGDDAGRLAIATTLGLGGRDLPVTIYAGLAVSGNKLTITPDEVEVAQFGLRVPASRLPAGAADARTIDLPELPAGLAYSKIAATPDGLNLAVAGTGLKGQLGTGTPDNNMKTCGGMAR